MFIFCVLAGSALKAQHAESANDTHGAHSAEHYRHQVQRATTHTHISEGRNEAGQRTWLALASWGINYNFHFAPKWSLGLHSDIILEDFLVRRESGEDVIVERKNPVALAAMGGYKFWGPFRALLGGGIEIEESENFGFIRFGLEPGWHFGGGRWEVSAIGTVEIKIDAYNSWMVGIGISRLF